MIAAPESSCWRLVALDEVRVVDRRHRDDEHEREHDAELAEPHQQLCDGVRAGAAARHPLRLGQ